MGHALVATYHYIRPENSDGVTGITPEAFRAQCEAIAARYHVVSPETFLERREAGDADGLALITFDDGLKDQFDYAAPILESLGLPGVFYCPMRPLCTDHELLDRVGGGDASGLGPWCTQHLLHALGECLGWGELERQVDEAVATLGLRAPIDRERMNELYHYEVAGKRRLKYLLAFALSAQDAAAVLARVNAVIGLDHRDWYMSKRDIRDLVDAGHAIGGHGFDHVPYTTLDEAGQERDMTLAQQWLRRITGAPAMTLAYPFGRADAVTRRLARDHGYALTFTTADRVDARDVPSALQAQGAAA